MPTYQYKAISRAGLPIRGLINANSPDNARELLAEKGHFVNQLDQMTGAEVARFVETANHQAKITRNLKLTDAQRCLFLRQLATALQARLPIITALNVLIEQSSHPQLRLLCQELIAIIKSGESLSYGISLYPRSFDRLHISLMAAGETAGNLDQCICQLAELSESELETRNEILTAALYPTFVLCLGLISVVIVVTWILPQILNTLVVDRNIMPWPTWVILEISGFMRSGYGLIAAGVLILLSIALSRWKMTESGRYFWDSLKLRLPVFGPVAAKWSISRFARTLGTLTAGGVGIIEGLRIVRNCLGNDVLARQMDRIVDQVRSGSSLAGPLSQSRLYPPLLIQIISVGEQTGKLSEQLLTAADAFDRETHLAVKRFMAVFPAILITLLALIIGFIVAATLLPIVQIETAIPGL